MKKILVILLVAALALTSAFAGGSSESTAPEAAAASVEQHPEYKGVVMLYTSTGEDVVLKLKEAFQAKYPNVDMQYYYAGSGKVVTKLSTEFETNAVTADIVWMADPSALLTWKKEGKLTPYKSPFAADINEIFKDSDDMFTAARMIIMGITYSTIATSDKEAPTTFWDMTKPEWKNQIVMSDPSNAGSTKTTVYALLHSDKYGWDFFKALKANGCELESSTGNTHNKVAAGAYKLCIGVDYNTKNMMDAGSPLGFHNTTDVVVAVPCPIAIPKGNPNPELAKLLYDFLLDPEGGQKILANDCNMTVTNAKTAIPEGMIHSEDAARIALPVDWPDLQANGKAMLAEFDKLFK